MDREIKFRGFDRKRNSMLYLKWGYEDSDSDLVWMQFTGLKDKNGKEIYEGDVLLRKAQWNAGDQYDRLSYVYWGEFRAEEYGSCETFMEKQIDNINCKTGARQGPMYWGLSWESPADDFDCEVIGNIFENHGLLKGEK